MAAVLATVPDPGLTDACGESPGGLCEAVWDSTDNETLAKLADWAIGRPLKIVVIILIAFALSRLGRRAVRRLVLRIVLADQQLAARTLSRVGVPTPTVVTDPRREGRARSISTVVASSVSVLVWVIAVILVIGQLGIDLAPLIAGAGIAGIALGFGAQSLVKDCLTGLFILIEDQYGIGDVVDLGEAVGVVERISLRTTVLRGQDGTVWHVPNGEVLRVGNRSQLWSVAVVDAVVGPDADLALARQVLQETAIEVCATDAYRDVVLEPPELLGVESVAAEGITLRLLVKTTPGAQFNVQRALREAIKQAFDRSGIDLPFPMRTTWTGVPSDPPA